MLTTRTPRPHTLRVYSYSGLLFDCYVMYLGELEPELLHAAAERQGCHLELIVPTGPAPRLTSLLCLSPGAWSALFFGVSIQHPEYVSDIASSLSSYGTFTASAQWGLLTVLLEQAVTNLRAPYGQLQTLKRPPCGFLGLRQWLCGITTEDCITSVFGSGLRTPPWAPAIKWAIVLPFLRGGLRW